MTVSHISRCIVHFVVQNNMQATVKFPNTTGAPRKENFPVLRPEKEWTDPENLCSHTLNVMGNFNGNVLAQKKGQKAKKPDFQTLP